MSLNVTILGQIISFILFVGCCMKYVWPPLIAIIEQRQKKIADDLAYAEDIKKKSGVMKSEADKYLQKIHMQAKDIINKANKYKMKLVNEAKEHANHERSRILFQAQKDIQLERDRVYEYMRRKFSSLIVNGVEQVVKRSIDQELNKDIVDSVVNSLRTDIE